MYWWQLILTGAHWQMGSLPDVTMSEGIYRRCPALFYMLLVGNAMMTITEAEGHTWVYTRTILSIHWYVQLSTGIFTELQTFKGLEIKSALFSHFEIFVQRRSSSAYLFLFFQVLPALHSLFFLFVVLTSNTEWIWIFHNPFLCMLLLHDTISMQLASVEFV